MPHAAIAELYEVGAIAVPFACLSLVWWSRAELWDTLWGLCVVRPVDSFVLLESFNDYDVSIFTAASTFAMHSGTFATSCVDAVSHPSGSVVEWVHEQSRILPLACIQAFSLAQGAGACDRFCSKFWQTQLASSGGNLAAAAQSRGVFVP